MFRRHIWVERIRTISWYSGSCRRTGNSPNSGKSAFHRRSSGHPRRFGERTATYSCDANPGRFQLGGFWWMPVCQINRQVWVGEMKKDYEIDEKNEIFHFVLFVYFVILLKNIKRA